jgi:hypothetical protein
MQIQLAAAANITLSFAFRGLSGAWSDAASAALRTAASGMAGGYDPAMVTVATSAPDFGVPTDTFEASGRATVTRVPVNNLTVGNRHHHRTGGADMGERRSYARRLLEVGNRSSGMQLLQSSGSSSSSSTGPWSADVPGSNSSSSGWTKVWISYTRLLPANTSSLLCALAASCGLALDGPAQLTSAPCGLAIRQALLGAGMLGVDGPTYEQWMTEDPMVSTAYGHARGLLEVGGGCCSSSSSSSGSLWAVFLFQRPAIGDGVICS